MRVRLLVWKVGTWVMPLHEDGERKTGRCEVHARSCASAARTRGMIPKVGGNETGTTETLMCLAMLRMLRSMKKRAVLEPEVS